MHALCRNLLSQSSIEIIVLKSNVKLFFRTWIELIDKLSLFKKRTSTNKSVQVFFWTAAGYHCFSNCFEAPTTILFSDSICVKIILHSSVSGLFIPIGVCDASGLIYASMPT